MSLSLNRWSNTAQNRDFRNKTNENWDLLERTHGQIEQNSQQSMNDSSLAKKQSKEAMDLSQSVQKQLNTIVANGDSGPEAKQAREDIDGEIHDTLKERLNSDFNKTAKKTELIDNTGYYLSKSLSNTLNYKDYTPELFYGLIEKKPYTDHPYFKISQLGYDHSGQYSIKLYKYEPKDFERTIFITGAVHGWENFGTYAIVELFKLLLGSEGNLPPQFKYIKDKVRILAIPVVNPWGMYQKKRQNSRGVDINRNFNWNWENNGTSGQQPWDYDYKGTAPFSETESQCVKKVFDEYKGNISAFLDLHHQGYTEQWDYLVYPDDNMVKEFDILLKHLTRDLPNPVIKNVVGYHDSSANNYASKVMRIPSATLESIVGRFGSQGGEKDNNKWFEYVFNAILVASRFGSMGEGFSIKNLSGNYADGAITLTNGVTKDITDSVFAFSPPSEGYVTVNGYIIAKQSNVADFFSSRIVIEQPGHITQTSLPNLYTKGELIVVPLDISIPVIAKLPVNIKIIALNEGTGVCNIKRYNLSIVYQTGKNLNLFAPGSMQGFTFA
ncbi:M14 family metallopeptidase [Bacillus paranthracis]|uniref:M14 family metallopeptidase n=1 Tax=Bacillus paranthracis TaxID=2026186 RepID=UPI0021117FFA|nr:M14 family metallopeptidase [Bacillus paranthracis]MCQ6524853.1 M14 family metallopeptidase [Bacillus paranthracis]